MDWTLINFLLTIVGPAVLLFGCIGLSWVVITLVGLGVKKWRSRKQGR